MNQAMAELLLSVAQSLNGQIVARLPGWLRATLFCLLSGATFYINHVGYLSDGWAAFAIGLVGGAFGFRIDKLLPGSKISVSLQQAPASAKPEPGTTTPLTPIVATPAVATPVAVVASEAGKPEVIPLGPEFTKP